ncbi:hypothetical protein KDL45_06700 [bacterium]|nr:hypothetical protein [bacterium]
MNRRLLPVAGVAILVVLAALIVSVVLPAKRQADIALNAEQHPRRPTTPLVVRRLEDPFAPDPAILAWTSGRSTVRDFALDPDTGAVRLAATDGGAVLGDRVAARPTGLPFTAALRVDSSTDRALVVGREGVAAIRFDHAGQPRDVHTYAFADPAIGPIADGFFADEAITVLTEAGGIYRFGNRRAERICALPKGRYRRVAPFAAEYLVAPVDDGLLQVRTQGAECKITPVEGLDLGPIHAVVGPDTNGAMHFGGERGYAVWTPERVETRRDDLFVTAVLPPDDLDDTAIFGDFSGRLFRDGKKRPFAQATDSILALRRGRDGVIFVGGAGGISTYDPRTRRLEPASHGDEAGLAENYTTALAPFGDDTWLVGGLNTGATLLRDNLSLALPFAPDIPGISAIATASDGRVLIGATDGLYELDPHGKALRHLTGDTGLIHQNVTAVLPTARGIYAATAAGLSLVGTATTRSIYAFHGLVNNHLYALARGLSDDIWVGTLGGLCRVGGSDGLQVLACLTEKDGLRHPWVSALVSVDDAVYVGTYGGGVMRVDAEGTLTGVAGYEKASVNLGAGTACGEAVVFGSLENGLLVAEKGQRLRAATSGLPSLNVTSVACADGRLVVGTDQGVALTSLDLLRAADKVD